MKRVRVALALGCAVAVVASLGGCREDEQDRVLIFDKGKYAGKPDTPVSAEAHKALRQRGQHQRFN